MYRILVKDVDHNGDDGTGLLLFCDETRNAEFFERDEFVLLIKFVKFLDENKCGVLRAHQTVYQFSLYDAFCIHHLGYTTTAIWDLRDEGYIISLDRDNHMPSDSFMAAIANPNIKFRFKYDAVVDTDGVLWWLNAGGADTVRLSDFCKRVAKGAVGHPDRFLTKFIFDDILEYAHPECFSNDNFSWGLGIPYIWFTAKYKDVFKFRFRRDTIV